MNKYLFWLLFFSGILFRFFFLEENLVNPHVWRQSDTANYIWDFYINGIDIFNPSVCWMGNHKTVILEFPLIEAIVSVFYKIFGAYHITAKLVFLIFYLCSCFYLYKLLSLFVNKTISSLTVLIYLFSPLSLFYSIAVHIDFSEMFFLFAMSYYYIKGLQETKVFLLILGAIFAILALLTKVPYALPMLFPLIYVVFKYNRFLFLLKHSYTILIPIIVYLIWQNHVFAINNNAPDWEFLLGYRKFTFNESIHWYFGTLDQRFELLNWIRIIKKVAVEVVGLPASVLFLYGISIINKKHVFFYLWLTGSTIYIITFFNLNLAHNYYQIPLISVFSFFSAVAIERLYTKFNKNTIILILLLVITGIPNIVYASNYYFKTPHSTITISNIISEETEKDDLLIINYGNIGTFYPNILYGAKRNGWMVLSYKLNSEILYNLKQEGANKFILITTYQMPKKMDVFLNQFHSKIRKVNKKVNVTIYDLRRPILKNHQK